MVQWKGHCYALKKILKAKIAKASLVTHVKAEKRLMAECDSPFLVNLVAAFQDSTQLYMMMELVQGGELFAFMRKRKRAFRESWAKFYAASVICAFEYLGAHNIVYRCATNDELSTIRLASGRAALLCVTSWSAAA
jgi:cGMP-dependent protein kinase